MTIRKSTLGIAVGAIALGVASWWLMRSEPGDRERIEAMLDQMHRSAEERTPRGILEHVAEDYRDDSGFDRDELRAYLTAYFLGSKQVSVTVLRRKVELQLPSAAADLSVLVNRDGRREGRRIVLRMLREGDEWKVKSSMNEPIAGP